MTEDRREKQLLKTGKVTLPEELLTTIASELSKFPEHQRDTFIEKVPAAVDLYRSVANTRSDGQQFKDDVDKDVKTIARDLKQAQQSMGQANKLALLRVVKESENSLDLHEFVDRLSAWIDAADRAASGARRSGPKGDLPRNLMIAFLMREYKAIFSMRVPDSSASQFSRVLKLVLEHLEIYLSESGIRTAIKTSKRHRQQLDRWISSLYDGSMN